VTVPASGLRYQTIGRSYARSRRTEPRIAAQVHAGLGDAATVVNVGAGTGNYEPTDRRVVALEPSTVMIAQRPRGAAPVVRGVAEQLPFPDGAFAAALGVLTIHHWTDLAAGLAELRRVAPRQVLLVFEPEWASELWMLEFWPEVLALETERTAPGVDALRAHLDVRAVEVVRVPRDCSDGFGGAFWARPERYLDPEVQAGRSSLAQLAPADRDRGSARLRAALASGEWDARFGSLRRQDDVDLGYRLVIAQG
jgi:SAM-dependent methyltransferase